MKKLSLEQLDTFAAVVELGSFSAAAERADISQPAVSLQIKQLERYLGVRLIERVGRRAQPTAAGRDLLIHARRIEKEASDALEAMTPYRSEAAGRIRIGTGATACIHLLPAVIARVKARMPGLEITVHTGNTPDILHDLEANRLDLAIVTLPAPGRSFEVEEIYRDEMVAVAPSQERLPPGGVDAAILGTRTLLLYEGGNTRRVVDQWFAEAGVQVKPAMEFGSVEAIKRLVGAGLGWAILPRLALDGSFASNRSKTTNPADSNGLGEDRDECSSLGQDSLASCPLAPRLNRSLAMVVRRDKHLNRGLREMMREIRGK
ncbi:LysR family transcriptional regulator [Sinorhizobium garamanticum]|uniref:LysR family transcriptional regulator n=1 Tax=Sinorhizobium garamanticum TaxID=680247 RepID=A0ABY8DLT5_9HYPH|nr:LysR family transcriptional regulator [Sinorhizobium garamanticum]WEX89906.1 LysR family transcriptional regulator [Sinorhizobium garamanticum]